MLFRDDPAIGPTRNSAAFWGAFSLTVLIGVVWIVIYLFEYLGHYDQLDPTPRREGWDPLDRWAVPSQDLGKFRDARSAIEFLTVSTPPFLGLLLLVDALPAGVVGGPKFDFRRASTDMLEYALGMLLGVLAVAVVVFIGWRLALGLGQVRSLRWGVEGSIIFLRTRDLVGPAGPAMATAVTAAFWAFLAAMVLTGLFLTQWSRIIPSGAICILFGLIVALYFVLLSLRQSFQLPFLIALVAFSIWSNSGEYKYRLPGMGTVNGASLYAEANRAPANRSPIETPGPEWPLLDNIDVLNAWKAHLRADRPKLVMVAVTGGALPVRFLDGGRPGRAGPS